MACLKRHVDANGPRCPICRAFVSVPEPVPADGPEFWDQPAIEVLQQALGFVYRCRCTDEESWTDGLAEPRVVRTPGGYVNAHVMYDWIDNRIALSKTGPAAGVAEAQCLEPLQAALTRYAPFGRDLEKSETSARGRAQQAAMKALTTAIEKACIMYLVPLEWTQPPRGSEELYQNEMIAWTPYVVRFGRMGGWY